MSTARDHFLMLRGGRRLCYWVNRERNGPDDKTHIVMHGSPGCRDSNPENADAEYQLVTFDRPGYGLSDPEPGMELLDWVEDIQELVDHLGIDTFSVGGGSGGGPFALACAYKLQDRVSQVILVSSSGPFYDARATVQSLALWAKALFRGYMYAPLVASAFFAVLMKVAQGRILGMLTEGMSEAQKKGYLVYMGESLRQGTKGFSQDMRVLTRPWRFKLDEGHQTVHVFYGGKDVFTPPTIGKHYVDTIPNAVEHYFPDDDHQLMAANKEIRELLVG